MGCLAERRFPLPLLVEDDLQQHSKVIKYCPLVLL